MYAKYEIDTIGDCPFSAYTIELLNNYSSLLTNYWSCMNLPNKDRSDHIAAVAEKLVELMEIREQCEIYKLGKIVYEIEELNTGSISRIDSVKWSCEISRQTTAWITVNPMYCSQSMDEQYCSVKFNYRFAFIAMNFTSS
ncbi:MAG: hypothetical protein LBI69_02950 [Puniceicoccales bacterium]|jgi:hypothetical protein|nr:hypothetical protein [Puniceicoccales bacterium]